MKINRDVELAINLLGELTDSSYRKSGELALSLKTTELFLQGIVLKLRKAGIVETLSGGLGGVKRPIGKKINALDIMKALGRKPKTLEGRAQQVLTNILMSLEKEEL